MANHIIDSLIIQNGSETYEYNSDLSKADKVTSATEGNFAGLDVNGNLTDSGFKASDFLTQHQDISGKVDGPSSAVNNQVAVFDGTTGKVIKDSGYTIAKSVPSDAKFTDTTYESKAAASGGTAVSLVTTGEKYTWNNKTSNTGTVTKISTSDGVTGGDITTTGTIKLATSGVTAGSYGPSAAVTGSNGATISVPYITVDKYGRITSISNKTYTSVDHTYTIPTDFPPKSHASTATTYGAGNASNYGHVKLSDTYTSQVSNNSAANSIGASARALQDAYNTLKLDKGDASNCNSCKTAGVWRVISSTSNRPVDWGIMFVFASGGYIGQIVINTVTGGLWTRGSGDNGSTWAAWK